MKIPANGFTHAGKFHADDVFATALLQIIRPDIRITRGFVVPDDFDGIVYDIGFGMFDHHQEPREYRANGGCGKADPGKPDRERECREPRRRESAAGL